jgi:hypothetical protein
VSILTPIFVKTCDRCVITVYFERNMRSAIAREDYDADADVGPITYRAKWSVTLRSLTPRT